MATGAISDQWRIRRDGRLLHAEALRAAGDLARAIAGPATLAGARALATLVARRARRRRPACAAARALLATPDGVLAAASARGDVLILRFLAPDLRAAARRPHPLSHGVPRRAAPPRLDALRRPPMNLTPREKDKLLVSLAAMVARARLARGVKLNHPEAIALITDFVVEGARDGRSVADLMEAGAHVVTAGAVHGGRARDDPRHPGRGHLPRRHQARHRARPDPLIVLTRSGPARRRAGIRRAS